MDRTLNRQLQRNRKRNNGLFACLYTFFIREKFCFVVLGFAFGVILTRCIDWINFESDYTLIEAPSYIDESSSRNIVEDITIKNQQQQQQQPSTNFLVTKEKMNFDNELLNGLQEGISLVAKNPPNTGKKVRILYIVGNEGSGHHLWENIMQYMAKKSDKINADYIDNNVILVECLHSCFMETWHKKKARLETAEETAYFNEESKKTEKGMFVEYSCNALGVELAKAVRNDKLPDGALIYLRSFSYPFMGVEMGKMPNIVRLINIAQNIIEIDIKIIVMKREWVECIVSACVHRYGDCSGRVQFQPAVLSMIQSQIMSIDPKFWIMIDYEDFVKRPMEYIDIINDYLLINDKLLIEDAIKTIVKASATSEKKSGWDELKRNAKKLAKLVENLLYSDYSKNMWPLYNSPYFCVTPENRAFLDSKYK